MTMPLTAVAHSVVPIFGHPDAPGRTFKIIILAEGFTKTELAQGAFAAAAKEIAERITAESPFRHLLDKIAIVRVDCESNASATVLIPLQPPPNGYLDSTPFSARWDSGIERIILGDGDAAKALVRLHPEIMSAQAILVVVNNPNRGGAARDGVGWITTSGDFASIFLHELGHSAFGLADEYDYTTGANSEVAQTYAGTEPIAANVTTMVSPNVIPWHDLVTIDVPLPSTVAHPSGACDFNHPVQPDIPDDAVGAFEGANERACGIFRPTFACLMRDGLPPLCPVCSRTAYGRLAGLLQAGKPLKTVAIGAWTHVIDMTSVATTSGQPLNCLVAYNAGTGILALILGSKLGLLTTVTPETSAMIEPLWTTMTPFEIASENFLLFAEVATNRRAIYRVDFDPVGDLSATLFTKIWDSNLPPERAYTHVINCKIDGALHVLSYDSFSGDVMLERIDSDGMHSVTPTILCSSRAGTAKQWAASLTSILSVDADEPLIVANAAATGTVWVARLQLPDASAVISSDRFMSSPGFMPGLRTHLASVSANGQLMIFSYSAFDGYGYFYRLRRQGSGIDYQRSLSLGLGGLSVLGFGAPALGGFTEMQAGDASSTKSYFWFYNAFRGAIRLGQFA